MSNKKSRGSMTVEEAGRMGGETTLKKHGREFYSAIGAKGGQKKSSSQKAKKKIENRK